ESDACREFPITLREQTIGRLQVHSPDGVLSEADEEFIQAVVNEVSLALENSRLLEETTRSAQREHTITEIATRVWAAPSIEAILRATLEELSARLSAQQGVFRLVVDHEDLN
ncbi:MAG: hypothetical protein L0Z70_01605, partial [Chloroflexi bacterium]|nr:hypothetical protein [Chloroflexota bacterium]